MQQMFQKKTFRGINHLLERQRCASKRVHRPERVASAGYREVGC
jgi:hypothetical protein